MGKGTIKTNVYKLLSDVAEHLEDCALGEYGYIDKQTNELAIRCRKALQELSEL